MYTWDVLSREYRDGRDRGLERRLMATLLTGDKMTCTKETKLDRTITCMDVDKSQQLSVKLILGLENFMNSLAVFWLVITRAPP